MNVDRDSEGYYSLLNIKDIFCTVLRSFCTEHLISSYENITCKSLCVKGHWIHHESLVRLLKWYKQTGPARLENIIKQLLLTLKPERKRAFSQKYRWDIAYEQQYKCGLCFDLLHPSFQVDHIQELCDGGTDTRDNCMAVCCNCHAKKTRASQQKRISKHDPLVNATFSDPFDTFKCTRRSPYFSNVKSV